LIKVFASKSVGCASTESIELELPILSQQFPQLVQLSEQPEQLSSHETQHSTVLQQFPKQSEHNHEYCG